jgi:hypothetical protein
VRRSVALSWLLAALAWSPAAAQQQVPPPLGETAADYRLQVGPVGLSPTFRVDNMGIDTNATLSSDNPVRDFMFRVTPGAAYMLPVQRLRLYGTTDVGFQYYQKTAEQRSVDTMNRAALTFAGNRLGPRVYGTYGHQQGRPNAEIETMVGQLNQGYGVGTDVRLSPRLVFQFDADSMRQDFEEQAFRGGLVNRQLNRTTDSMRAAVRITATPITTLVVSGVNSREKFAFSPERDAESQSVLMGVETKPSALISGSATVGYRRFNALDDEIPDDRGVVADVAMGYTLLDRTRFGVNVRRNLEFSAERLQPYYIVTGLAGSITQMIGLGWDVRVGGGGETLAYQNFVSVPIEEGRKDHVDTFNFGFGRKVGDTGRIGLEVGHVKRRSPIEALTYEGWRAGMKVTYGS